MVFAWIFFRRPTSHQRLSGSPEAMHTDKGGKWQCKNRLGDMHSVRFAQARNDGVNHQVMAGFADFGFLEM